MRIFFSLLTGFVLLLAFLSPFFSTLVSQATAALILIVAALITSICTGAWWFVEIKQSATQIASTSDANNALDRVLKQRCWWLQAARPVASAFQFSTCTDLSSIMVLIRHRFMSSYLFVIGLVGLSMTVFFLTDESSTWGVFGKLLQSQLGKGLAIAFMLYLSISSFAFFVVGLLAFFDKGESK